MDTKLWIQYLQQWFLFLLAINQKTYTQFVHKCIRIENWNWCRQIQVSGKLNHNNVWLQQKILKVKLRTRNPVSEKLGNYPMVLLINPVVLEWLLSIEKTPRLVTITMGTKQFVLPSFYKVVVVSFWKFLAKIHDKKHSYYNF